MRKPTAPWRWVVAAILLACAIPWGEAAARASETLRGLRVVRVEVEEVPAEARELGLTRGGLLLEMVGALSAGGVAVLGDDDFPGAPALEVVPELALSISTARHTLGVFAVLAQVELREEVLTLGDPWAAAVAVTWRTSRLAVVRPEDAQIVRDAIRDAVDDFLFDLRRANVPEEPVPGGPDPEGPVEAALRTRG